MCKTIYFLNLIAMIDQFNFPIPQSGVKLEFFMFTAELFISYIIILLHVFLNLESPFVTHAFIDNVKDSHVFP